jgi:hypothetical protein
MSCCHAAVHRVYGPDPPNRQQRSTRARPTEPEERHSQHGGSLAQILGFVSSWRGIGFQGSALPRILHRHGLPAGPLLHRPGGDPGLGNPLPPPRPTLPASSYCKVRPVFMCLCTDRYWMSMFLCVLASHAYLLPISWICAAACLSHSHM